MAQLRKGMPELPERMKSLPVDARGYPVPYFVARPNGKPDHRIIDPHRIIVCINFGLCQICGKPHDERMCFVVGPLGTVQKFTMEPPCHRECALFAVQTCPWIVHPQAKRRDSGMPEGVHTTKFQANPGAMCLWSTDSYELGRLPDGRLYMIMAEPIIPPEWYYEGRPATRPEVDSAFGANLEVALDKARAQGFRVFQKFMADIEASKQYRPN